MFDLFPTFPSSKDVWTWVIEFIELIELLLRDQISPVQCFQLLIYFSHVLKKQHPCLNLFHGLSVFYSFSYGGF